MRKTLAAVLVAGAMLGLGASRALASPAQHFTVDVRGATFTCTDATYTIVSGSVRIVLHEDVTASGNTNLTGTITPQNVAATNEAGNLHDIVGAARFGGSFNAITGGLAFTGTEKFQIIQQRGGTVDSVNITAHFSPNGDIKLLDFGTCIPPEGEQ